MMLIIEEKALSSAKEKNGSFLVKTISASGGCCDVDIKDIVVELLKEFNGNEKHFNIYEYEGVKVFIEKYLKTDEHIELYQRFKLPLIGNIYKIHGVSVKYL